MHTQSIPHVLDTRMTSIHPRGYTSAGGPCVALRSPTQLHVLLHSGPIRSIPQKVAPKPWFAASPRRRITRDMIGQIAPSPHEDGRPAPFLRLPNEVIAQILSYQDTLTLPDLGRLCLVHPRLAPLSRRAAAKHPQRRYLHAILGRVPQDVLCIARANSEGQTGWLDLMAGGEDTGPGQLGKVWDAFGDGHDATVQVSVRGGSRIQARLTRLALAAPRPPLGLSFPRRLLTTPQQRRLHRALQRQSTYSSSPRRYAARHPPAHAPLPIPPLLARPLPHPTNTQRSREIARVCGVLQALGRLDAHRLVAAARGAATMGSRPASSLAITLRPATWAQRGRRHVVVRLFQPQPRLVVPALLPLPHGAVPPFPHTGRRRSYRGA